MKLTRWIALLAAVGLVSSLVLWLVLRGVPTERAPEMEPPVTSFPAPEEQTASGLQNALRTPASIVVSGTARLHGTPTSSTYPQLGTLHARCVQEAASGSLEIPIQAGHWTCELRDGAVLEFTQARVGEMSYRVEPARISAVAGHQYALTLLSDRGPKLKVIDAQTGNELRGFEVHRAGSPQTSLGIEPPPGSVPLAELHTSPCWLPEVTSPSVYWVGMAGYAWTRIAVNMGSTSDRCVPLHRACQVEFWFENLPSSEPAELTLRWRDSEEVIRRVSLQGRSGSLSVKLQLPAGEMDAQVLPSLEGRYQSLVTPFFAQSGSNSRVLLNCEVVPLIPRCKVAWWVQMADNSARPEAAHLLTSSTAPSRNPLAHSKLRSDESGTFVEFDSVAPGNYLLVLMPHQWTLPVTVEADASSTPRPIFAPLPTSKRVELRGARVGSMPMPTSVMWAAAGTGMYQPASMSPDRTQILLSTSAQALDLLVYLNGISAPVERQVQFVGEQTAVVLELQAPTQLSLRIHEGDGLIPMRASWWRRMRLEPIEGEGRVLACATRTQGESIDAFEAVFLLSAPGRYRVLPADGEFDFHPADCLVECNSESMTEWILHATPKGCAQVEIREPK